MNDSNHAALEARCAALATTFGFRPLLGRLYAQLLLAGEPLSLGELATRVSAAKSTVCVAIHELETAGLASRESHDGDRRDFYQPVDPLALVLGWHARILAPELAAWRDVADSMSGDDVAERLSRAIGLLDVGVHAALRRAS